MVVLSPVRKCAKKREKMSNKLASIISLVVYCFGLLAVFPVLPLSFVFFFYYGDDDKPA